MLVSRARNDNVTAVGKGTAAEEADEMGVLDPPERVCRRSLGVGRRLLGLCRTTGGHIEDKTGIHQASLRVIVGIVFPLLSLAGGGGKGYYPGNRQKFNESHNHILKS